MSRITLPVNYQSASTTTTASTILTTSNTSSVFNNHKPHFNTSKTAHTKSSDQRSKEKVFDRIFHIRR